MSKGQKLPQYHVLNFFHDNDNACALTVLIHHVRYHVIVDPSQLKDDSHAGNEIAKEYEALLDGVKEKEKAEAQEVEEEESKSRDADQDSQKTNDSGVDVHNGTTNPKSSKSKDAGDPRATLDDWILSPLSDIFAKNKPDAGSKKEHTVQRWYHCQTYFYHLAISSSKLTAEEERPSDSLFNRIKHLVPSLTLPKYILDLEIPIISAEDLVICSESSDPDPIHPALVRDRNSNETHFLKVVDPTQPGPTKREIRLLKSLESKGLHNQFRVPLVQALVSFSPSSQSQNEKKKIMGLLLTPIPSPTPLTFKLDPSVPPEKRNRWAEESSRIINILHENGIIWGDAKGDNFVVDAEENLWIIDFGGSYTPGWVDPELKETEEGDEQGLGRLVNGLRDPVGGTTGGTTDGGSQGEVNEGDEGEDEEGKEEGDEENEEGNEGEGLEGKKRKRGEERDEDESEDEGDEQRASKERKVDAGEEDGEEEKAEYCTCGGPEAGPMIACDGEECKVEWFHMACVGVEKVPKGKWFCEDCREE